MARKNSPSPQGVLLDEKKGTVIPDSTAPADQPLALVPDEAGRQMPAAAPAQSPRNPMDVLLDAIQNPNLDIVKLERLMALQKEWATEQARKAFVRAMVEFKRNIPQVRKNRKAKITPRNGGEGYTYDYADLPSILNEAVPALANVGITTDWDMEIDHAHKLIQVTCIVTHEDGYSKKVKGGGPFDDSGGKNPTQTIASANSYWQRYTFLAAVGMSTSAQEDDDGNYAGVEGAGLKPIDEEQLKQIEEKLRALDPNAETALLRYLKVDKLKEIPIQAFELAIDLLARRKNHPPR